MNLDASMMPAIALIASINDVKTASAANVSLTFPVSASDKLHRSANRYNERQLRNSTTHNNGPLQGSKSRTFGAISSSSINRSVPSRMLNMQSRSIQIRCLAKAGINNSNISICTSDPKQSPVD